jgi:hypothetical protein
MNQFDDTKISGFVSYEIFTKFPFLICVRIRDLMFANGTNSFDIHVQFVEELPAMFNMNVELISRDNISLIGDTNDAKTTV